MPDMILTDADTYIAASPFEKERIIEVLQSVFKKGSINHA
jgi:hypothetical protein